MKTSVYQLECECINKTTGKPYVIVTNEVEGICPNCGRQFVIRWGKVKSARERFYDLFNV